MPQVFFITVKATYPLKTKKKQIISRSRKFKIIKKLEDAARREAVGSVFRQCIDKVKRLKNSYWPDDP